MRTIVLEEPFSITIRLEGGLTAEVTGDLSRRVAEWQAMTREKKMRLDLGDVSSIDAEGASWLHRVRERGVHLTAISPAVRNVTGDIESEKDDLRAWLARLGIRLAPRRSTESMSLFRRILCALVPAGTAGCPCER